MTNNTFHIVDYTDDYLHHLLPASRAAYVEQHAEGCVMCKAALDEARKRQAVLANAPTCELPDRLIKATLDQIADVDTRQRRFRKRFIWTAFSATAASVLILTSLTIYYSTLKPSSFNLTLLGQNRLLADTVGSLHIRLTNHVTGAGQAGVPVEIALVDLARGITQPLATFNTDSEGSGAPRFRLPDWPDGQYHLRVRAQTSIGTEELIRPIKLYRSWKLMLTCDKPVYQPGSTIHVRSLALRQPDLHPVTGQRATFTITDPKDNIIFKQQAPTSRYGITSADCPLADEIQHGTYLITCQVGDTTSRLAIEVKKYVLPKFKVEVLLDQPYALPGQRVTGRVHAEYFYQKPVAGGEVKLEVIRAAYKEVLKTDESGDARFELTIPPEMHANQEGITQIELQASVRDSARQEARRTGALAVAAQPIRIEAIPEGGSLVAGIPNTVYLLVTYPDGRPVPGARANCTDVRQDLLTDEQGVASFQVTPNGNSGSLAVSATDRQGLSGSRSIHLAATSGFLVRTDKAVYNGGDTMRLTALGTINAPVFVDLIKDGQTILSESLNTKPGTASGAIDLPADLFGTIKLCGYMYNRNGNVVSQSRILYIRPASHLAIHAKMDRETYRPAGKAKLQLGLTDGSGKPVPGAISLSAVDEAVFSVLDRPPGLEDRFYNLDRKLLKPVTDTYSWSPDFNAGTSDASRNRLEQALFARTAHQPGQKQDGANLWDPKATSPHSLGGTTYSGNIAKVQETRAKAFKQIEAGWIAFGIILGFSLCISLGLWAKNRLSDWMEMPTAFVVMIGIAALTSCVIVGCSKSKRAPYEADSAEAGRAAPRINREGDKSKDGKVAKPSQSPPTPPKHYRGGDPPKPVPEPTPKPVVQPPKPIHVRERFPETLYWRPEIITDDQGRAAVDIDLADSITTWRLSASAVSGDGRLGASQQAIRVFQPFFVDLNLPVTLTRNDSTAIDVVVTNYLKDRQKVTLTLEKADWFDALEGLEKSVDVPASEHRPAAFRIKVKKVGKHILKVKASGVASAPRASDRRAKSDDSVDIIKRQIEVIPDGRKVETVASGVLDRPVDIPLSLPANAIPGSAKAILKIYPSRLSEVVEGLDAIFQMPHGCFEQTSSTTYPNILALDYLRRTKKSAPAIEAKAMNYIQLGYQRLVSFEVQGGGFDWFGRPPANVTLTAYGLMEFKDMARVHGVDPQLIQRTRNWLLSRRNGDGSWWAESHMLNDGLASTVQRGDLNYTTTAYVAWAVFNGQQQDPEAAVTLNYLLQRTPSSIKDPYTLALVCNALLALDPTGTRAYPYLDRLENMKTLDGKLPCWRLGTNGSTAFYGAGQAGSIETTALAVLAFTRANVFTGTTPGALAWLARQKDGRGTWHSTQATVLALKALLAGTVKPQSKERRIEIKLGDQTIQRSIAADQADVLLQLDLTSYLQEGDQRVKLNEHTRTGAGYQLVFRYHLEKAQQQAAGQPLSIDLSFDRAQLAVNQQLKGTARVTNHQTQTSHMTMVELPIPPGFTVTGNHLADLQTQGTIARYQLQPGRVLIYLTSLKPNQQLDIDYQLQALQSVDVAVAPARVWEYYNPAKEGKSAAGRLKVK